MRKKPNRKKTTKPSKHFRKSDFKPTLDKNREDTTFEFPEDGIVLNKYVALCGICSRRKAVEYVKDGKIKVNNKIITVPYHKVQQKDKVYFEDKLIKIEEKKVYILMNKPKNCITTAKDPEGRKTVLDIVANACKERVFAVGRLDRNTTGLLLLTNDGDLAKKLSHPSSEVKKLYYATLDQSFSTIDLEKLLKGLDLEDGRIEVDEAGYVEDSKRMEVGVEIHSGRNRIVRRIFEHLGYEVKKLDRIYFAGLTKKDLPRGKWRYLTDKEVIMLKHFTR